MPINKDNLDDYDFYVQYEALADPDPDVDVNDPNTLFMPQITKAESFLEAIDWYQKWAELIAQNPNARNLRLMYSAKVSLADVPKELYEQHKDESTDQPREESIET